MLYNFCILFKLIKSSIVLVSSKLRYASFPYKITSEKIFKINYLNRKNSNFKHKTWS